MMAAAFPPPTSPSDEWGEFVAAGSSSSTLPQSPIQPRVSPSSESNVSPSNLIVQAVDAQTSNHPANQPNTHPNDPPPQHEQPTPLQGFDTLDPVQRYALGAVTVVLLNDHAIDLNGAAFARSQAATILQALGLREGQQAALLALEPDTQSRDALVEQCTTLVGDEAPRFAAIQAMLALSVAKGIYDARSRAFLAAIADSFGISWRTIAAVELAVAVQLFEQAAAETEQKRDSAESVTSKEAEEDANRPRTVDELLIERRKKKMKYKKAVKISGITLAGGLLFGLTGGLIAPGLLAALAGVGVASAAGLAASGAVASGAVVGGLFGVAGAGFTVKKARNRVSTSLQEFDFERADDPRVIEDRKKKAEKERRKLEKLVAARLKEEAEANAHLAIEGAPGATGDTKPFDPEKELPRPPSEDEDDEESDSKKRGIWKKKKKREKVKVGVRGLEAAGQVPGLHVCICVPAWLNERSYGAALDQFEPALKQELPCSQHIALRWESRRLYEMGLAFAKFWASKATVTTLQQTYPHVVAAASTVAGAVAFAFAMPLTVMSCMDYVDNPWSILVSRSNGAGDELADVLVERSYGQRPVSLFGYSIGARVVFKCLESLASRGALGIVDNVYVMGAAVTADPERWKKIRQVVAGRIVNAYGSFDMALACFHRGCGHGVYIAGLRRVEVEGVENLNMAFLGIEGHRELKDCVPRVMKYMGVGTGYIVMPPARLVQRRGRSKSQRQDSPVCEEPERARNRSRDESKSSSPIENSDGAAVGLENTKNGSLVSTNSFPLGVHETRSQDIEDIALPPNLSSIDALESKHTSSTGDESGTRLSDIDQSKKKKSKSWLSWNSWSTLSGKKSGKRPKQSTQNVDHHSLEVKSDSVDVVEEIESLDIEDSAPSSHDELHGNVEEEISPQLNVFDERARRGEHIAVDEDYESNDDIVAISDDEGIEPFDWEKQRRIWEEQERQMQERGYADSAAEIEMKSKVILGIGIEVAGRRLCPFIEQDADLPVERKEEVFTNCMEDQQGVLIRVYEYEKRTKSVPINTLKHDEQYPKLLGEMEVRFKASAVKGKLRVAVAVWACENGDICAEVEERLPDGEVGKKAELKVPRSELCTMDERIRLEAAERKRVEAQVQKELRARATPDVLALPAASESDNTKETHDADTAQSQKPFNHQEYSGGEGSESNAAAVEKANDVNKRGDEETNSIGVESRLKE